MAAPSDDALRHLADRVMAAVCAALPGPVRDWAAGPGTDYAVKEIRDGLVAFFTSDDFAAERKLAAAGGNTALCLARMVLEVAERITTEAQKDGAR